MKLSLFSCVTLLFCILIPLITYAKNENQEHVQIVDNGRLAIKGNF